MKHIIAIAVFLSASSVSADELDDALAFRNACEEATIDEALAAADELAAIGRRIAINLDPMSSGDAFRLDLVNAWLRYCLDAASSL